MRVAGFTTIEQDGNKKRPLQNLEKRKGFSGSSLEGTHTDFGSTFGGTHNKFKTVVCIDLSVAEGNSRCVCSGHS